MRVTSGGNNNWSIVHSNKHFCAFFVLVYGSVKDRKLSTQFEKTGAKMIACIYYDSLRHVNSNINQSSSFTIYRLQDIGVPNDDRIWLKKTWFQVNIKELDAL